MYIVTVSELLMFCSMRDKVPALSDFVASKSIDLLGITEPWLTTNDTSADLADMTPEGFSFFHKPRTRRRGAGVDLFISSVHKFTAISRPSQTSFEAISGKRECGQSSFIILNIYHPPGPATAFSVKCKIFCPTYLHSLMIWL